MNDCCFVLLKRSVVLDLFLGFSFCFFFFFRFLQVFILKVFSQLFFSQKTPIFLILSCYFEFKIFLFLTHTTTQSTNTLQHSQSEQMVNKPRRKRNHRTRTQTKRSSPDTSSVATTAAPEPVVSAKAAAKLGLTMSAAQRAVADPLKPPKEIGIKTTSSPSKRSLFGLGSTSKKCFCDSEKTIFFFK